MANRRSGHRHLAAIDLVDALRLRTGQGISPIDVAAEQLQDFRAAEVAPLLRGGHGPTSLSHQRIRAGGGFGMRDHGFSLFLHVVKVGGMGMGGR
jgi:hypothetical protein